MPAAIVAYAGVAQAGFAALSSKPVRLLRNGRQRRAVGLYFSVKNGRHLPFESTLELHDLWRVEVDAAVVASRVQPFTLQLAHGGERWRYTPDRLDLLTDGSERIVEVKDDGWADMEPGLAARLQIAADELRQARRPLHVHNRALIQAEPSFSAVEAVQRHRRTAVSAAEQVLAVALAASGELTLGELQERLGGGAQALAAACALVVRRVIAIDLQDGLHDDLQVRAVE